MKDNENDDWLEDFRSQMQSQLKSVNRRKEELETNLKKIDELIEMNNSFGGIQELNETNSRIRAENDQLRAELDTLKLLMNQDFKH